MFPLPAVTESKVGWLSLNNCVHAGRYGEKSDGIPWPWLSACTPLFFIMLMSFISGFG